jgi:hypothetical protein
MSMNKSMRVLFAAGAVCTTLVLPAAAGAQTAPAARPITLQLATQNNSGVAGTATLTDIGGGRTRVEVRVSPGGNPNMPAHIHEGTCATLNPAPKFPLNNVMNGTSTSEVNATIAQILAAQHSVNLHKSPQEASIYTACATIVAGAAGLPATGSPGVPAVPIVPALAALGATLAGLAAAALRRRSR